MKVNGAFYNFARNTFRKLFQAEPSPFPIGDSEKLFPGLYERPITLGNLTWKWGDVNNEKEIIFLCALAKAGYSPIVEFGTFRGRTTYNLALNSEGEITTIDIGDEKGQAIDVEVNAQKHAYATHKTGEVFLSAPVSIRNRVRQIIGDSTKLDLSSMDKSAGLVIVDGGHSYEVCKSDSEKALRLVKPGGVVVWDDYTSYWPGVRKALDELSTSTKLHLLAREGMVVHSAAQ